jgi:hypothetical protein
MSKIVTQAEADAAEERRIQEWVDSMTPEQLRAFLAASTRRLAQLKAQILADIQAEGITEQEWIARQRAASAAAWAALKRPDSGAPQASDDDAKG